MEARKLLIQRATRVALGLASKGQSGGVLLENQPFDVSDLLVGAGFSMAKYDETTGHVSASWGAPPTSSLERQMQGMVELHKNAQRAETLLLLWPKIQEVLQSGKEEVFKAIIKSKIIEHYSHTPLPNKYIVYDILRESGMEVIDYVENEGYYHESGSGMGHWLSPPSVTMSFKIKQ